MNPSHPSDGMPRFLTAACVLAHCLVAATLPAQSYAPQYGYGPHAPGYAAPYAAAPYGAAPAYYSQPYGAPQTAMPVAYGIPMLSSRPATPYCPPGRQPGYLPPPQPPSTRPPAQQPQQPDAAQQPQGQDQTQPQAQQQQQPQQQDQPSPTDFAPADTGSRADLSPGMNTPQLGRNDQSNRLNIFDNMAAAPQSRVWFGLQYSSGFDTALQLTDAFAHFLSSNPHLNPDDVLRRNQGITRDFFSYDQRIYRVGGEWAPKDYFSIAIQGQYYASSGGFPEAAPDDWTNPQLLAKLVLARDCDTVLTGTLGATTETENERGEINEGVSKIYPGFLFYEGLTRDLFLQGGAQAGMPLGGSNEVYTADWSLSLGYWLYRDPCPCGPGRHDRPHFLRAFKVTGIIPQINVLGKHTVGNNRIVGPFGFDSFATLITTGETTSTFILCDPVTMLPVPGPPITITTPITTSAILPEGFVVYREPRDIVDLTIGGQVLFGNHIQLGLGYSFPLTGESVRQDEFLSTLTFAF